MISLVIPVVFLWAACKADDYNLYAPQNGTKPTLSGIAAYRSALTLDWLAAEDMRQRELASAFETDTNPPPRIISSDCIGYARPASGKVARLMLELLKNLEGDDGTLVMNLIQALVRTKLLVETTMLDSEPDLESLVKTPSEMMGEPHTTFPRILAMMWMVVTDPVTSKKFGWCPISRVSKYLTVSKPVEIANQMRALEPIIARARFIMENFIQHVTPLNMVQKKLPETTIPKGIKPTPTEREVDTEPPEPTETTETSIEPYPTRTMNTPRGVHVALAQEASSSYETDFLAAPRATPASSGSPLCKPQYLLLATIVFVFREY